MNTYDQPLVVTYQLDAATLSSAAELATFVGPSGRKGRVVGMEALVTTAVTTAAAVVTVNNLGDTIEAASLTVPVGAADTFANAPTLGTDDTLLPADTAFTIDVDGAPAAGAANLTVTIAWF